MDFVGKRVSLLLVCLLVCHAQPEVNGPTEQVKAEVDRCGEIIDAHLHIATWFNTTAGPLLDEMDAAGISRGIMLSSYLPRSMIMGADPNEFVSSVSQETSGRILGLASLNVSIDWEEGGKTELDRMKKFLDKPEIVGAKLPNSHNCLELESKITREFVTAVSTSPKPLFYLHTGTTPFCGPLADIMQVGFKGCCSPEYVDPSYLEAIIQDFPNVTFVLLHSGHDFLQPNEANYYNNSLVDNAIEVATSYSNVYLEISAFLRSDKDGIFTYPLGDVTLKKIADANLGGRIIYGSDRNHFPGGVKPYLSTAISLMTEFGFTEEDRCKILSGNAVKLFGLEMVDKPKEPVSSENGTNPNPNEPKEPGSPTSSSGQLFPYGHLFHISAIFFALLVSL